MILIQLGRYGDIINILPFAFMLSKQVGGRIRWLVGKEWASILEGTSYVEPISFDGNDFQLDRAIRQYQGHQKLVTQANRNPDPTHQTDSFAKEQWRYVNALDQRGKWPLVFDRRDAERERKLIDKVYPNRDKPLVLVGRISVSTPYLHASRLLAELTEKLDAYVVALDWVVAERLYDLIGLYDAADLLVTVDTCHLHLARASQCPVIALVNDGWMGATPPPQTVAAWRYAELGNDLSPVIEAAQKQLARKVDSIAVVCHSYDPNSDRHRRAMATHPKDTIYAKHDHRPRMKELFAKGLNTGKDAVIFTNDDVTFPDGALDKIKSHLRKFDFGCSRRPRTPTHIGREIFWFNSDWLNANWHWIPDAYWSVQKPDLILCRWLRQLRGIPTTMENLNYDFAPVEVPDVIFHEDHKSAWANPETENSREGLHNEKMWREWPLAT